MAFLRTATAIVLALLLASAPAGAQQQGSGGSSVPPLTDQQRDLPTSAPTEAAPPASAPAPELGAAAADLPQVNPDVVMRGSGWGHSVGMSQYGAYAQALAGRSYQTILKHYYQGIAVGTGAMPARIRVGLYQDSARVEVEAVSGPVNWHLCNATLCHNNKVATQLKGRTWTIDVIAGRYTVKRGSTVIFSRQVKLGSVFRQIVVDARNTTIEGPNPNGRCNGAEPYRCEYRGGSMEFRAHDAVGDSTMYVVFDIPSVQTYLRGLGEMPSSWGATSNGLEALKAQAVAGRTYAVRLHYATGGMRADCRCSLLATPANQVYLGRDHAQAAFGDRWVKAVNDTAAVVATHGGALISTVYSSSHGGRSEHSQDSWAFSSDVPYLNSVADPWSLDPKVNNPYAHWNRAIPNATMATFIGSDLEQVRRVRVLSRTAGGTPRSVEVTARNNQGNIVKRVFDGGSDDKNIAGVAIYRRFNDTTLELRSQQISKFGFHPFVDDDALVHEYNIVTIYAGGITSGCDTAPARYCPFRAVTRAEMATFLVKALDLPPTSENAFVDDNNSIHEANINALAAAGITAGCDASPARYCPGQSVTRAEMASFLVKGFKLPGTNQDFFSDDNNSVHESNINRLAAAGITAGCDSSPPRYCPGRSVTRAEMATFIVESIRH